jgi:hypothetical protein
MFLDSHNTWKSDFAACNMSLLCTGAAQHLQVTSSLLFDSVLLVVDLRVHQRMLPSNMPGNGGFCQWWFLHRLRVTVSQITCGVQRKLTRLSIISESCVLRLCTSFGSHPYSSHPRLGTSCNPQHPTQKQAPSYVPLALMLLLASTHHCFAAALQTSH